MYNCRIRRERWKEGPLGQSANCLNVSWLWQMGLHPQMRPSHVLHGAPEGGPATQISLMCQEQHFPFRYRNTFFFLSNLIQLLSENIICMLQYFDIEIRFVAQNMALTDKLSMSSWKNVYSAVVWWCVQIFHILAIFCLFFCQLLIKAYCSF